MKSKEYTMKKSAFTILVLFLFLFITSRVNASEKLNAGGVTFEAPASWEQTEPHTNMRLFEFKTTLAGAEEQAVMAVFYFPGMGGSVESNIERWKSQFTPEPGSAEPEVSTVDVNGSAVTLVRLEGTYNGGMGFSGSRQGYAAIAAIADGTDGPVFFKMTGPKAVVEAVRNDFDFLVQSFSPVTSS